MNGTSDANRPASPMRYHRGVIATSIVLVVLHILLMRFAGAIPAHRLLFLMFFCTAVLLPGFLLSKRLVSRADPPFRTLLSFVCGFALMYIALTVLAILRWPVRYIGIVAPVVTVALTLLPGPVGREEEKEKFDGAVQRNGTRIVQFVLVAVLVLVTVLALIRGDPILYTSDSPDHIAYIRTISRTGEVFPEQFLYRDGGTLTRDLRKGLGDALWGGINTLTGRIDADTVWPLVSVIGSVFITLALFCAGSIMFKSSSIGLLSALLFLLVYNDGFRGAQLTTIAYSFPFGKIFLVTFITAVTRYLTRGMRIYLVIAALASLAASGTHINHFLIIAFVSFIFSVVVLCYARGEKRRRHLSGTIPLLAVTLIPVNLPYLLLRYVRDYAPNNEIHSHVQGILYLSDRLVVMNPFVFYNLVGPLFVLSVISAIILWTRARRDETLRLLSWGTIAILAVVFNPALVPLLLERISYLLMRFEFAVPSMLLPACLIRTLWRKLRGVPNSLSTGAAVCGWIAVFVCIGPSLVKTPAHFAYSKTAIRHAQERGCRSLEDLFQAIDREVPPGSIIASDPITSYCIPAFTDRFVMCTFDQHSIPNDSTALDRIIAARDIFDPKSGLGTVTDVLEKYGAGYLAINGRIPLSVSAMFWKPGRERAENTIARLSRFPELFRTLYRRESAALFAYDATGISTADIPQPRSDSLEFTGALLSEQEIRRFENSGQPYIYIAGVSLSRNSVDRGGTLTISIEWVAAQKCPPRSYNTYVRFNGEYPKGPLYRDFYSKIYRKVYQLLTGGRYRLSVGHLPKSGIYPPDKWPPRRIVTDTFTVRVPRNMSPGVYTVSVKLAVITQYPNYTIRDFLNDRDYISGAAMAEVTIE